MKENAYKDYDLELKDLYFLDGIYYVLIPIPFTIRRCCGYYALRLNDNYLSSTVYRDKKDFVESFSMLKVIPVKLVKKTAQIKRNN